MDRILIPEKIYVGCAPKQYHAHVTAWGTDASAIGRMTTVRNHSGGQEQNCTTLDNMPMVGFEIVRTLGGQDWLLSDPRGFRFTLRAGEVQMLMKDCVVIAGVIQQPCVYGRSRGYNVLLPIHTHTYDQAVKATQVSHLTASWKTVQPGNRVVLQTGVSGIYLGKYHKLERGRSMSLDANEHVDSHPVSMNHVQANHTPMLLIHDDKPRYHHTRLYMQQSAKLAQITDDSIMTPQQAEQQANQLLMDPTVSWNRYQNMNTLLLCVGAVQSDNFQLHMQVVESDPQQIEHQLSMSGGNTSYYARHKSGMITTVVKYGGTRSHTWRLEGTSVSEVYLPHAQLRMHLTQSPQGTYLQERRIRFGHNDIKELMQLNFSYTSALGNVITGVI